MTMGEGGRVVRLELPGLVGRAAAIGGIYINYFPEEPPIVMEPDFGSCDGCLEVVRLNNKVQWFAIVSSLLIGIQATQ